MKRKFGVLKDIFKNNPHPHPLLCLDGISTEDLNNIMDYIYNGEVNLFQDKLDSFLAVAQRLKLQGLIETPDNDIEKEEILTQTFNEDPKIEPYDEQKVPEDVTYKPRKKPEKNVIKTVAVNEMDMKDVISRINQYMEECSDGSFKCAVCGKISTKSIHRGVQKQNMEKHIETHLEGLTYTCPICDKTFRSRNCLAAHKTQQHKSKYH